VVPAFNATDNEEVLLSLALILFVALLIPKLARQRKPDHKMALLLSLVEGLPGDAKTDESSSAGREEAGNIKEHGPPGSGGFTLSA
jgi:hypothetical protein